MSASSSTAPAVGSRVRVTTSDGARRALLLCVHDATVEVEYETGGEAVVPISAISALLPFEYSLERGADETAIAYAERCKSEGNSLYKLRDASAAAARYADGANALQQAAPVAVGGRALVKCGNRVRGAFVTCMDGATADVEYERAAATASSTALALADDGDDDEAEEEDGVSLERLTPIHPTHGALQCALTLNLARCAILRSDWNVAMVRAARAERIAAHDGGDEPPDASLGLRRSSLHVGARAACGAGRFRRATALATLLLEAPRPAGVSAEEGERDARRLLRDIERQKGETQRSNRRLAKSVASWVQTAMAGGGGGVEQLESGVAEEGRVEEEEEDSAAGGGSACPGLFTKALAVVAAAMLVGARLS